MKKTLEDLEREKYELRMINRKLQEEETIEELKRKHFISGTIEEQKAIVVEKSEAIEVEATRIIEAEKVEQEQDAKDILDQQATQESEA